MTVSGLPATLWGYALEHFIYVYTNTPQELLNQRTPYEALFGKPSRLQMLKTFGCLAYMFVPKSERTSKLSNPAIPCVFVGYAKNKLGYSLYNPNTRTIQTSRSVKFDETKLRNGSMFHFRAGRLVTPTTNSTGMLALDDKLFNDRFDATDDGFHEPEIEADTEVENHLHDRKQPEPRQSKWTIKRPKRFEVNNVSLGSAIKIVEPQTFQDLDKKDHSVQWIAATNAKYQAKMTNNVWDLAPQPPNRKALKSKRVWKAQYNEDGSLERLKARVCLKGYLQIAGVDVTDPYAPVLCLDSLRILRALIAKFYVETAFLNVDLEEDIYMEQPELYQVEGKTHLVFKLKKSIYGLKLAPRQWYKKLDANLTSRKFKRCHKYHCIYVMVNSEQGSIMYLTVYVDDIVIATKDKQLLHHLRKDLSKAFEMTDKGELSYLLGIKIERERTQRTQDVTRQIHR
ncbi:hypothetical protein AeNC1_009182 [Aphanomyces euteiches]|nr:hypothetical protein AeNC1_009182 [Aphanomyces euteiches]